MKKLIFVAYAMMIASAYPLPVENTLPTPSILPQRIYALDGKPCAIRFDTLVFAPVKGSLLYDVESGPGAQYNDRLAWNPKANEAGPFKIGIYSGQDFHKLGEVAGEFVHCDPEAVKTSGEIRWLAIGDSHTQPGHYLAQTVEMLRQTLPRITLVTVGTQQPKDYDFIRHEGRGGWSWPRYLEAFPPKSQFQSPFVFGPNGSEDFDFGRYLRESLGGKAPEIITILLGGNDVYPISADFTPAKIDEILHHARTMVQKIRAAAPDSVIGIIPSPLPSEQNGFGANYGNGVTEWQYRRALQYYIAGLLREFDGRWNEQIYIVPGYLGFDPATAFPGAPGPSQNALHPTADGFKPISLSISAWIVHLLSKGTI